MQVKLRTTTLLAAMLLAGPAAAAITCGVSTSPLTYGMFDPDGGSVDSENGLINVSCQAVSQPTAVDTPYTIAISAGNSGSFVMRRMANAQYNLLYNIYVDATRAPSAVWGDGTSGTLQVGGTIFNLSNTNPLGSREHTLYGRIPGPQTGLGPGNYSDSLVISLSF
jgi:spore coat protein U-like protein